MPWAPDFGFWLVNPMFCFNMPSATKKGKMNHSTTAVAHLLFVLVQDSFRQSWRRGCLCEGLIGGCTPKKITCTFMGYHPKLKITHKRTMFNHSYVTNDQRLREYHHPMFRENKFWSNDRRCSESPDFHPKENRWFSQRTKPLIDRGFPISQPCFFTQNMGWWYSMTLW